MSGEYVEMLPGGRWTVCYPNGSPATHMRFRSKEAAATWLNSQFNKEPAMSDELLAADIRSKIEALNAAVRRANEAGLYVNFDICSHTTNPSHAEIVEAWIERPGDRASGVPSVKL